MDNKAKDLQEAIRLYQDQYIWQHMTHRELADYLVPCIALSQYHIFRYENTGVAYAFINWAFLSDSAQKRFKETGILEKFDWDSGKNVWHIDIINNHKGWMNKIYSWITKHYPAFLDKEEYVNWIRLTKSGNAVKKINRIKVKDGVKKFK